MLETLDLKLKLERDEYVRADSPAARSSCANSAGRSTSRSVPSCSSSKAGTPPARAAPSSASREKIDPRGYVVYPISAPQGEDKTRHYLYRFWRRLPERGQIAIFDRSWYGRVLVERVEGFAANPKWKRAYKEINSFERQLRDFGAILAKFWIHISRDEQLRRFEEREAIGYKAWKLTDEDWRNRGKWSAYEEAVDEMLLKTSTRTAPWTLVEGNDKYWARVKILSYLVEVLSRELDYKPQDPLGKAEAKTRKKPAARPS